MERRSAPANEALAAAGIGRADPLEWLTGRELIEFDAWFEAWASDGQRAPEGDEWRTWLLMAGRGFGKTRAGAEWVHRQAVGASECRIALVGATMHEARGVMVEGRSGLIAVAASEGIELKFEPTLSRLRWPGGAEAHLFSGENPEGLRGPEHHVAWCDELAKWRHAEAAWDNLQMGLRAGAMPRALVTTPPRSIPLIGRLIDDEKTVVTGGHSRENLNLPPAFLQAMEENYGDTSLARQELDGQLIAEPEGSLFPRSLLNGARVSVPDAFDRIVVGVDPPASSGPDADTCGIVVAGEAGKRAFVLADLSIAGLRPEGWARAVVAAAEEWMADRVIAEANQGGDMVESVLRAADANLPVTRVFARRGKVARAEPIAVRFESGRAFLGGRFDALEDQLNGMLVGGDYQGPGR